jgi:hypothetical protein
MPFKTARERGISLKRIGNSGRLARESASGQLWNANDGAS